MLTGTELLAKVKELGEASRTDVARACGYVSTKKDGSERINFTAFYEAIMEAKGVTLAPPASKAKKGSRGKAPSYKATISAKGMVPIGAAYTSEAGWGGGDTVGITVNGDTITLIRIATAAPEVADASAAACEAPAPVVVTDQVITYESKPAAAAARELAPF
jgi:hypothetical protein